MNDFNLYCATISCLLKKNAFMLINIVMKKYLPTIKSDIGLVFLIQIASLWTCIYSLTSSM